MELRIKDSYRVESADFLNSTMLRSLYLFYQPLITTNAVALYMTLYSESFVQKTADYHSRLSSLLNLSIEEIERARIHLEEYKLLDSFLQESDTKNKYIYSLKAPLSEEEFISNSEFLSCFARIVGKKQLEMNLGRVASYKVSKNEYRKVTRIVSTSSIKKEYDASVEYSKLKPKYDFSDSDTHINFDYEHFFATTSTLVFPAELRTEENLKLIGKLATIYGLSVDKMRIILSRCTNLRTMSLNTELLKVLAQKSTPDVVSNKDPYLLPPVSFLQAKQNGAEVSLTDKKILEDLSIKMHFSNEVINILIEYILKKSQNRLVKTYVDMVAGEWARDGVTTREDAIKETKKRVTAKGYIRQTSLPEYMNQLQEETDVSDIQSQSQLEEVQKLLEQMKDEHAKD